LETEKFDLVKQKDLEFRDLAKNPDGSIDEELDRPNVAQMVALKPKGESLPKERGVVIGNSHLYWNWNFKWTRVSQVRMLEEEMLQFNSDLNYSVILCGDFNASPDDLLYNFLTRREISLAEYGHFLKPKNDSNNLMKVVQESLDLAAAHLEVVARIPESEEDHHRLAQFHELMEYANKNLPLLESAYQNYTKLVNVKPNQYWDGEPPFTSYSAWKGTLDYIFTFKGQTSLILKRILELPKEDEVNVQTALPNDTQPSDHLYLIGEFQFRE